MIDRATALDFAEKAGFGGQSRAALLPRLLAFANQVADWQKSKDARVCSVVGDSFKSVNTEFADGQMDGAYRCAELLGDKQ